MSPALQPWRNMALEAVGLIPDSARHRIARVRRHVETITTDAELDDRIQRATDMFVTSDDEARRYLGSFEVQRPMAPDDDPFSARYISAEWDLYRRISRRDQYDVSNESMDLDIESALVMPYPYSTGSPVQVADQLGACSFIIRSLGLERSMRVVEFGPGWGNLTLQFAMMGIETTAVEVEPRFAELLRRRGSGNTHLDVVVCDMLDFEPPHQYDAAIFYESFHHCSDHLRMLRLLHSIVNDTGVVVFAAEPLGMPYPWGLRLDGLSVFCTRKYGWLELGFGRGYFSEALKRTGWHGKRLHSRLMSPLADMVVARRGA
jgi:SAM-dependent methyltransferase